MSSQGFCQGQGLCLLSALFSGFIILKVSVYFLVATVQRKCSTIVKKFWSQNRSLSQCRYTVHFSNSLIN